MSERGEIYLIMDAVNALVDSLLPMDDMGQTDITPEILAQVQHIQDCACDALAIDRMPLIAPDH